MSFAELCQKSNNKFIALFELDISSKNIQWVNNGAGIWVVNFDASYPWVDASLLDGFTSQQIGDIGSVVCENTLLTRVYTLLEVTSIDASFYYDASGKNVYVRLPNADSPYIHNVYLGVVYGFSTKDYIPIGVDTLYQGRILSFPEVSFSRDPLFFGKITYSNSTINIINADGEYDSFAQDNNIYGNPCRIKIGFEELDISEYETIYTGYVGTVSIDEESINITMNDKRKQLTRAITYVEENSNALDVITHILASYYGLYYNSSLYNTAEWEIARLLCSNVTINMQNPEDTISVIEQICNSVFGLFIVKGDGKFSFKVVDTLSTAISTIYSYDILNNHSIEYDSSEVISSTRIGYSRDWTASDSSAYSWINDISQESAIHSKYKTYNQKEVKTLLINSIDAQEFSTTFLNYSKDVHGITELVIPLKYYGIFIGDIYNAQINRQITAMLGTIKCEVIKVGYNLNQGNIKLGLRII